MKGLLVRALRSPPAERRSALEAVALLTAIWVGLRLFPLPAVRRALDRTAGWLAVRDWAEGRELERVVRGIETAGRFLLGDRPCLAQALAVQWQLHRRSLPAELCIGVRRAESGGLAAHAWIESEGRVVTGGPEQELGQYTRLSRLEGRLP